MKKTIAFILALIWNLSGIQVSAQEIVELRQPASNKVVIKIMFRNGSVCDPVGKEGLTALTTSLLVSGGTRTMTSTEITRRTYPWATRIGASTDKEVSIITFEVLTRHLEEFYPILRDMILDPGFGKEDFTRVLSNQQNYVDEVIRQSSDEEYGKKWLEAKLFSGTAYEHLTMGTSASLPSITVDDVKKHYSNFFVRNRLLIGIAGNYSESFLQKLKSDMGRVSDGNISCEPGKPNLPSGINVSIIAKEGAMGSAISAGFPIDLTRANDDFAALMVANSWLGEHRKSYSRLYQKIREARSMNYGDYTYIEWYENGGSNMLPPPGTPRTLNYFSIWLRPVQTATSLKNQYPELESVELGHAAFALRMALREMQLLIDSGMTKDNFIETREFLKSYTRLYAQTTSRQLGYLMDSRFYGRNNWLEELSALLDKVTLQDVNIAMKKYWQTRDMQIVIVTDPSEAGALNNALGSGMPTPMSYSNSLKGTLPRSLLKEDEIVAKYPLQATSIEIVESDKTFRGK